MSRTSSLIDESCFPNVINHDTLCVAPPASSQPLDAQSRNPNSNSAHASSDTVHRTVNREFYGSPAGSLGSRSSGACHTGGENSSPRQNTTKTIFEATVDGRSLGVEQSSQEGLNDTGLKTGQRPYLAYGDFVGNFHPSVGIDQAQRPSGTKSIQLSVTKLDNKACTSPRTNAKGTDSMRFSEDEGVLAETISSKKSSSSRQSSPQVIITGTAPKSFKRIVSSIRSGQFRSPQRLRPSEERQDLGNEFEPPLENNQSLGVPQQCEAEGHRKTSSGVSSGFLGTVKSPNTGPTSSSVMDGISKPHWSRSRWSKFSKGSSTFSETPVRASFDSDRKVSPATHKATADRALQRRRIIEELISSETGYIYDLRILTHVCSMTAVSPSSDLRYYRYTSLSLVLPKPLTERGSTKLKITLLP